MSLIDMKSFSGISAFFQAPSQKPGAEIARSTQVKTLCIAGARQPDLDGIARILQQAGMAKAGPAKREERMDMAFWHAQVLGEEDAPGHAIHHPGKLWEHMAAEIFLANAESRLWGWADTHSTWLLDYWQQFEPRMGFLLVCTPLSHMLAGALLSDGHVVDVSALVNAWQAHHQALLQFHRTHPKRSLLLSGTQCDVRAQALVQRCADRWHLPLSVEGVMPTAELPVLDPLALYLAEHLSQSYPQALLLERELATAIDDLGAEPARGKGLETHQDIVVGYRQLRDRSAELAQLKAAQEQQARLQKEVAGLKEEKTTAQARKSELEKQARREALEKEIAELKKLHATQEADKAALAKARDEQAKLAAERAAKVDELSKARQALEADKAALAKARDEQTTLAADRQAKVDALNALQAQHKEAEQENELLLLQLHQVQEELEHYFLQHQKLEKQVQSNEIRWARMLRRNPSYIDYESIEFNQAKPGENQLLRWRFKNVIVAERAYPDLSLQTFVQNGMAGFVFTRDGQGASPLMHWPAGSSRAKEVVLAPTGTPANIQQRIEAFYDLSTSDWAFIKMLPQLLTSALERQAALRGGESVNPVPLRVALDKFSRVLEKLPPTLRWDTAKLQREQVDKDDEHLWIRLENISFGDRSYPEFEFRLSCAEVRPDGLGQHARLQFPESPAKPLFQNWMNDRFGDFGAMLEVRMTLPDTMDMEVWKKLSIHDRAFVASLVKRLGPLLQSLKNSGCATKRPWEAWLAVASGVQRLLDMQGLLEPRDNAPQPIAPLAAPLPTMKTPARVASARVEVISSKPASLPALTDKPAGKKRANKSRTRTAASIAR